MPWTFPGAGIRVAIVSELGIPAGSLEPFFYGLVQDDGTIPTDPFDFDTSPVGWHAMLRVRYTGTDPTPIAALAGSYPTRIEEGKYYVQVFTVGYIQRADCTVYIVPGFGHDVQLDLVQGTHVRVELRFTHENVATAFNGFVRVEVYNQEGTLIGASIYAGAAPNPRPGNYLPYSTLQDWKLVHGPAEGANTTIATAQRAYISALRYRVPPITWALWPAMNRSDANRLNMTVGSSVVFDVFGFHSYSGDSDSRMEQFWANGWDTTNGAMQIDSGMRGSRDMLDLEGSGSLTVRVWAFDPYGPDGVFNSTGRDGIFGNDDDYTAPDPIDAGISDFRAYAQVTELENVEAPWTGTVAVRTTLEEQPSLLGTVSWIDMYGDLRTLPWAQVVARTADDVWASSATGSYRLWLPQGPHEILVTTVGNEQLWQPFQFEIVLSRTGVHIFNDVTLQTAETVTPEFTSQTWVFAIPLIATSALVSKRQRNRAARSDN
jgi:hypothetical protein